MNTYNVPAKMQELEQKVHACWDDEAQEQCWKLVKNYQREQVVVSAKPSTEYQGRIFRGIGEINASPEACFKHCHPKPELTRADWDTTIKAVEIVEMIQDNQWPEVYILRTMTESAAMGLISSRDFIDLIINVNNDKLVGTMAESVITDKCPVQNGYVRGTNHYCGILCCRIPGESNKTKVVYLAHAEIGGSIPSSLVDAAVPSAICNFFSGLKKQLKKEGQLA